MGFLGTPLPEANAEEDVEFAEADEGRRTELGAGCVPDVGTPLLEAIEGKDGELAEADTECGCAKFRERCALAVGAPLLKVTEGEPLPLDFRFGPFSSIETPSFIAL